MTKILWFSRHEMTAEQLGALERKFPDGVTINKINKTINSAREIQDDINEADIIAIVAPIGLQAEFLRLAGDKPVITALTDRVLIPQPNGEEDKVEFRFVKWERLEEITVIKSDFAM